MRRAGGGSHFLPWVIGCRKESQPGPGIRGAHSSPSPAPSPSQKLSSSSVPSQCWCLCLMEPKMPGLHPEAQKVPFLEGSVWILPSSVSAHAPSCSRQLRAAGWFLGLCPWWKESPESRIHLLNRQGPRMHLNPESRGLLRSLRVLSPSPFRAITVLPWQKPPPLAKSPFSIQALHGDRAGGACELVSPQSRDAGSSTKPRGGVRLF